MMTYRGFSLITIDRSTTLATYIFAQATSVIIVIIIVRLLRSYVRMYGVCMYVDSTFTRGIFVLRWVINNVVACQLVGDSCRNKLNHSGPRARTRQNV